MNNDPNEIAEGHNPCRLRQARGLTAEAPTVGNADVSPDIGNPISPPVPAPAQTPEELAAQIGEVLKRDYHIEPSYAVELIAFAIREALAAKEADLAAERAKREANDLHCQQLADEVLAERDAAIQRAEQAEARLAEAEQIMQPWRDECQSVESAVRQNAELLGVLISYLGSVRQPTESYPEAIARILEEISSFKQQLAQANERLTKVTSQMNAAVKSWRQGQEQLVAEAAKCAIQREALDACRACVENEMRRLEFHGHQLNAWPDLLTGCVSGGGIIPALELKPSEALQRYGLEVGKSAYIDGWTDRNAASERGFICPEAAAEEDWQTSQTHASLTGQTDGKGAA